MTLLALVGGVMSLVRLRRLRLGIVLSAIATTVGGWGHRGERLRGRIAAVCVARSRELVRVTRGNGPAVGAPLSCIRGDHRVVGAQWIFVRTERSRASSVAWSSGGVTRRGTVETGGARGPVCGLFAHRSFSYLADLALDPLKIHALGEVMVIADKLADLVARPVNNQDVFSPPCANP